MEIGRTPRGNRIIKETISERNGKAVILTEVNVANQIVRFEKISQDGMTSSNFPSWEKIYGPTGTELYFVNNNGLSYVYENELVLVSFTTEYSLVKLGVKTAGKVKYFEEDRDLRDTLNKIRLLRMAAEYFSQTMFSHQHTLQELVSP